MRLLFDQNLPPRLAAALQVAHPGSAHVRGFGLQSASDPDIWEFAKGKGFTVVSKDADFHQMSFLFGPPPKVIWIRIGNCTTDRILAVLLAQEERIARFEADEDAALLVLS